MLLLLFFLIKTVIGFTVASKHSSTYHNPVMVTQVIDALLLNVSLNNNVPRIYLDCTLGGGGHSEAILESLGPNDLLVGVDQDQQSLDFVSARINDPRFVPLKSNFRDLARTLPTLPTFHLLTCPIKVDGMFMDLGVSSNQIDVAGRGFSFMQHGPLDMRMNTDTGSSAADVINKSDESNLVRILRNYGDEPRARKIAKSILEDLPINTTTELVNSVGRVVPEFHKNKRLGRTATLARVFQAFRICVNDEMGCLSEGEGKDRRVFGHHAFPILSVQLLCVGVTGASVIRFFFSLFLRFHLMNLTVFEHPPPLPPPLPPTPRAKDAP